MREGEEEGREYGKRLVIEMLKHLKIGTKECYFGQAIFSSSSLLQPRLKGGADAGLTVLHS